MQNKEDFLHVRPLVSLFVAALLLLLHQLPSSPMLSALGASLALIAAGDGAAGCGSQPIPVLQCPSCARGLQPGAGCWHFDFHSLSPAAVVFSPCRDVPGKPLGAP